MSGFATFASDAIAREVKATLLSTKILNGCTVRAVEEYRLSTPPRLPTPPPPLDIVIQPHERNANPGQDTDVVNVVDLVCCANTEPPLENIPDLVYTVSHFNYTPKSVAFFLF